MDAFVTSLLGSAAVWPGTHCPHTDVGHDEERPQGLHRAVPETQASTPTHHRFNEDDRP